MVVDGSGTDWLAASEPRVYLWAVLNPLYNWLLAKPNSFAIAACATDTNDSYLYLFSGFTSFVWMAINVSGAYFIESHLWLEQ